MENIETISKNYVKLFTSKNKECYLEKDKYILNLNKILSNGDKLYRCKNYLNKNYKCPAKVKFDPKDKLLEYNDQHSCKVDEIAIQKIKILNEVKTSFKDTKDIFTIKAKDIFDSSIKKATKRKNDNIPEEAEDNNHLHNSNNINNINIKTISFDNIKDSIYRYINKQIPKDIEKLEDLPDNSIYYNTISGDKFMFYKNNKIVILMSPMQAQLCYNYNDHCFIDGTFYTAPKCAYQIITLRIHNILEDCFYTVGYGILTKKDTSSYIFNF